MDKITVRLLKNTHLLVLQTRINLSPDIITFGKSNYFIICGIFIQFK